MKTLFSLLIVLAVGVSFFASCGAPAEVVEKATTEMCGCMENMNLEDPTTMMGAVTCMGKLIENKEYESITEAQFEASMAKKCPEGAKKFNKLVEMGEE